MLIQHETVAIRSVSDCRLAARAFKAGWPMPDAKRAATIRELRGIVADAESKDRLLRAATDALITAGEAVE